MKQQFLYINGGVPKENYSSYIDFLNTIEYDPYAEKFKSWNKTLWEHLWDEWEYLRAPFRERQYADYMEWKIMFEKLIPFMRDELCIWAGSLGATFIMKYIWENDGIYNSRSWKKIHIKKLFLIAAGIADTPQEKLGSFHFDLEKTYHKVSRWCEQIYIYHSSDDPLVPFQQSLELKQYFPEAIFREFDDRGHFYKEERLLELEQDLQQ